MPYLLDNRDTQKKKEKKERDRELNSVPHGHTYCQDGSTKGKQNFDHGTTLTMDRFSRKCEDPLQCERKTSMTTPSASLGQTSRHSLSLT